MDTTELLRDGGHHGERVVVDGYVSRNRPAPTSFSDGLWVILPEYSVDHPIGPCEWGAIHGATLPAQGARVTVVFGDREVPVVVWWAGGLTSDLGANVQSFGATGREEGDESEAFLAALKTSPRLFLPAGKYSVASQLVMDELVGGALRGVGGISPGAAAGSLLRYTGEASSFISARSVNGFTVQDVQVFYSNPKFTGTLIDFGHGASKLDANNISFLRAGIGGAGIRTASQLVSLDNAIIAHFTDTDWYNAVRAILGRLENAHYSNAVTITGGAFNGFVQAPIQNIGQGWTLNGPTFENLYGGGAGAILSALGGASGLSWNGGWTGDANTEGIWLDAPLSGAAISGVFFGAGATGINLRNGSAGVSIAGNTFSTMGTGVAIGAGCTNIGQKGTNFWTGVATHVNNNGVGQEDFT